MKITLEIPCLHGESKAHTVYDPAEPPSLRDICRGAKVIDIHPDVYETFSFTDLYEAPGQNVLAGVWAIKPRDLFKKYEQR